MRKRSEVLAFVVAVLLIPLSGATPVHAQTDGATWTTQADFEHNGFDKQGNPGPATLPVDVDTATLPGSVFLLRNGEPNLLVGSNNLIVPESRLYVRDPSVAYDPSRGTYAASWIETDASSGLRQIHARILGLDGTPQPELGEVTIDPQLYVNPVASSIAYNPLTGHFLLTWRDPFPHEGIWAIRLDGDMNPVAGSLLEVNSGSGDAPASACSDNGECLVVWQRTVGNDNYVWARSIDAAWQLSSGESLVSVNPGRSPAVAAGAGGAFLVVWDDADAGQEDVLGRMVAGGTPAGAMETQISDFEIGREYWPAAAYNGATGTFLVTWVDQIGSGDTNVFGRQVNVDMTALPQIELCTATANQVRPKATYVEDLNQWVVAWWDGRFGYENWDVYARAVGADDSLGQELHVAALPNEDQEPTIAAGPQGDALVLWRNTIDVGNNHDLWTQVIGRGYAPSGSLRGLKLNTGAPRPLWGTISWTASTPAGTTLRYRTRSASKELDLATATWSEYYEISGSAVTSPAHRWLEIEMSLDSPSGLVSPLVEDFTVTYTP